MNAKGPVDPDDEPQRAQEAVPLPAPVRQRVVTLAADVLGGLPADQVPPALRAVARFTPNRRARAGAGALATALESDPLFRQRVAASVRGSSPDVAAALDQGTVPAAADPIELAAIAYLTRPDGWDAIVTAAAGEVLGSARAAESTQLREKVERLTEQLRAARADADRALAQARAEATALRGELADVRRRVRELEAEVGRARSAAQAAGRTAEQIQVAAEGDVAVATADARKLRARVAELEAAADTVRRAAREGRGHDDVRLRLLLDTLLGAAAGLRQELALPPAEVAPGQARPADKVAADQGAAAGTVVGVGDVASRALASDDPAVLERLLALPRVHLVVDGYNVTKSGYGALPLEQQRSRLLAGLAALAARTRAEVTCVFDGTTLGVPVVTALPRGVRVLFSAEGQTADELIDRLVRAEPPGRPVVVVSTDREVADRAAAAGARAVPSLALLRRLDRA